MSEIPHPDSPVTQQPPMDKNVFIMIRFRDDALFNTIETTLKEELKKYGLNAMSARKHHETHLWENVKSFMDNSLFGIAVYEQIDQKDVNPNISRACYELCEKSVVMEV